MGVLSSREGCQEDQGHQGCQRWTIDSIATKEHLPEVRLRLEAATLKGKARIFKVMASKLIELNVLDPNHYVQTW